MRIVSVLDAMSGGGYTVALAQRDRVDYSVSKGGLRLWAVLFVFIVLCSSLYTALSSRDMFDMAIGMVFYSLFFSLFCS